MGILSPELQLEEQKRHSHVRALWLPLGGLVIWTLVFLVGRSSFVPSGSRAHIPSFVGTLVGSCIVSPKTEESNGRLSGDTVYDSDWEAGEGDVV